MHHQHLIPESLLRAEIQQRLEEGCVSGDLPQQIEASIRSGTLVANYDLFWEQLGQLHSPLDEPSDLEGIHSRRPDTRWHRQHTLDEPALFDRVYGAWLGRCAGCTLGKPVEGWSRTQIANYLRTAEAYPLKAYFPVVEPFPPGLELRPNYIHTSNGRINRMVRDDDLDYTVLALRILEEFGFNFSTHHVALAWLHNLPYYQIYTAEAVAYHNLVIGFEPTDAALYRNPYREWIGAQIRADLWGYANPGDPQRAAGMAHRDAALSHTGNGIYGSMWAAAAIAAAFVVDDPRQIVLAGLAEIPKTSRLAEAVRNTMQWAKECTTWEEAWERVNARYGQYNWIHVINNTCSIVLALLYGQGDLERSICLAVMGGWDTDCTGATTGSILGTALGAKTLPEKWISPLQDRLESYILGESDVRISDLARRTCVQIHNQEGINDD